MCKIIHSGNCSANTIFAHNTYNNINHIVFLGIQIETEHILWNNIDYQK